MKGYLRFIRSPWRALSGAAVLSIALLAGCATSEGPNPMTMGSSGGVVLVTVQNNDFKDAAIYANWVGSTRRRIGMVTGKTTETFRMDWQSELVRFQADFIAGGTLNFEAIDVWGGDHLELVILNQG